MTRATLLIALLAVATLGAGCAERLDHLGRPPSMTAPGGQIETVAPITPTRAALAMRAPAPPPEDYAVGSLWRSGKSSLFGDRRANRIGDILTVVIDLDESAEMTNRTNRARSGSEDASITALLGLPSIADTILPGAGTLNPAVGLGSSTASAGTGTTTRQEEIELRIAATVTDVLPNGHLVIFGSQEMRVNFELRDLQVAGVIRPEDISRRNEITYDKIADARVVYGGRGQITDLQQPRYGQQVLDMVLPF
ncbi:MAG: flagellar basal body L-ring protein FlgH [Rubrimonas sp.]|uniref:flagellar basal body L-ring protein FlgH n=1 Tax=Rubrimonas sp. TaxID=2036015 RepID=UPI002FDCB5C9